ncbi:sensor histidine kinase [Micromonospora sp. WMMA1998]|uniref:sensor histidine kinase n=1 Tax=Micromonospora sp. WMMA1998 TaxID=3015167 RepID=UPI00248C713B|nr:sensor histidine kinase [Micromonospora sp. WMMA1998]WBC15689.1 sensor histidine kinase [Micromonospora sp. WMMA1998]
MSEHVPLARPAVPVSGGDPPPSATWVARFPLWDAYFAVLAVAVGVAVATSTPPAASYRAGSAALLAAIGIWYVAFGRALMRYDIGGWRAYLYLGVAFALYAPAVVLASSASFAMFVLLPQAFMLLPTIRAVAVVVSFTAVPVVKDWLSNGAGPDTGGSLLAAGMVALVVSVTGGWIRHLFVDADRRAALVDELAASRDEVARLSRQAGVATERQRLAGEIHDTIAQGLSSVVMLIQAADAELDRDAARARRHLALAVDTARSNLAGARAVVAALTPAELAGSPLVEAVRRVSDRFVAETGVPVVLTMPETPHPLPTPVEVVLLRVAQEALANARKHAGAGRVEVRLDRRDDAVVLEVRDDGRGFTGPPAGDGYGLAGMRHRVERVAGTLRVTSGPGAGTTVRAEVPIR